MTNESISSLSLIFRRHRWTALATFFSVICGSFAYLVVTPPMYEATAQAILSDKQLSVSDLGNDLTQSSGIEGDSPIATQVELARSQQVLELALTQASQYGIKDLPDTGTLKDSLTVSTLPGTGILEINYRSQNPTLTAGLLNAVLKAMIEVNASGFRSQARAVREFLEIEVPKRRAQLVQSEAALSQYKRSQDVVSLTNSDGGDSTQTQSLVTSLADVEQQERALSAQLQEARARDSSLQKKTNNGTTKNVFAAVRAGQNEELQRLRAKLAELESELSISRTRFTDNNPTVLKLLEERNATRTLYGQKLSLLLPNAGDTIPTNNNIASDQVSQELATKLILGETERSGIESKLAVLRRNRANLQARLKQLPAKEQALSELIRGREEAASSVKLLQSKLEEARIAEAQLASNISIIERAESPEDPNWPNKPVVLVIATAAGIILAISVVLLLEVLDGTLRNATEARKLVNLPVLGVLPSLPTTSLNFENSTLFLDDSSLVEPYRTLLKTMEFRNIQNLQVVVVSSTLPGEGKSVVVSHLAAVAAIMSRRTLIIDADLHCPIQQKVFNLGVQLGLTDVINGYIPLAQAVQSTGIENLSVLMSGEPEAYSSRLLESTRMNKLLAEAAAQYDLVIIDTSPVTSCIDATVLSRNSDGLLLVTRPHFTQRELLVEAVSKLRTNQVNILGIAVNGVNTPTEQYYRYPVKAYQSLGKHQSHLQRLLQYVNK